MSSTEQITVPDELQEDLHDAFRAWVEHVGADHDDVMGFEDAYCGEWASEVEYAEQLVDDLGMLSEMPENLRFYFDYEAFARDLFLSDNFSIECPDGGVWVFYNT